MIQIKIFVDESSNEAKCQFEEKNPVMSEYGLALLQLKYMEGVIIKKSKADSGVVEVNEDKTHKHGTS